MGSSAASGTWPQERKSGTWRRSKVIIRVSFLVLWGFLQGWYGPTLPGAHPGPMIPNSTEQPLPCWCTWLIWCCADQLTRDRKSVVSGKSVSVRVDLGGRRIIKKKKKRKKINKTT